MVHYDVDENDIDFNPPELKHADLLIMKDFAIKEFNALPAEMRFPGMKRGLFCDERLAIAWLRASLMVLNRAGAFKEEFLKSYKQPLETPDSFPVSDDPDWEQSYDGKTSKRKP